MIVSHAEFELIRNPRIRSRLLHLPVRRGKHGELKRCPARAGGVYRLTTPIPYDQYRGEAERQPGRSRAVLWLIDRCKPMGTPVVVTVREPPEMQETPDGLMWVVRFVMGDQAATLDGPVLLAKSVGYTTRQDQKMKGEPEVLMPLAADLAKARAKALEKRLTPQQEGLGRMRSEAETLMQSMKAMKDRNRLKLIVKEIDKLAAKVAVDDGGTLAMSVCAESQVSVAAEDGSPPNSTTPSVSLESAA